MWEPFTVSLAATHSATKRARVGNSKIHSTRSDSTHPPLALTPLLSCKRQRRQPFFSSASVEEVSWHQASDARLTHGED